VKIRLRFDEPESSSARKTRWAGYTVELHFLSSMAKRGENNHEDAETTEEREARVDEMLVRAKRAHRTAAKKKPARRPARDKKKRA
jgi:hypothetical protein